MIIRTSKGLSTDALESPFIDVKPNDWFFTGVAIAWKNNLMSGMTEKTFSPNGLINREQMFSLLGKGLPALSNGGSNLSDKEVDEILSKYTDSNKISDSARRGTAAAIKAGIVKGYANGTLSPQGDMTRAEAAVLIYSLVSKQ
jgi:hypothetical protein